MADCEAELLINLVKSKRAIYDSTMMEHGSRSLLEKLWEEVSQEMHKSVAECKAKWASLRNSYARALRDGKTRNSGSSGRKRRKWYLADSMDFLYNFMNQHKPSSTSNNTVEYWEEKTSSLDQEEVIEYENEEEVEHEQLDSKIEYEDPTSTGQQQQQQQRTSNSISKIIKPTVINDDVLGPIIEHLLTEVKASSDKENPDWGFFKSLMPDVTKLTAKRRRKFKEIVLTNLNKLLEEDEIESAEFVHRKEFLH